MLQGLKGDGDLLSSAKEPSERRFQSAGEGRRDFVPEGGLPQGDLPSAGRMDGVPKVPLVRPGALARQGALVRLVEQLDEPPAEA